MTPEEVVLAELENRIDSAATRYQQMIDDDILKALYDDIIATSRHGGRYVAAALERDSLILLGYPYGFGRIKRTWQAWQFLAEMIKEGK